MTLKTRLSVLLISTPVLAFVVIGGLMGNASARAGDESFQHLRVFDDVVRLVVSNYVEDVKVDRAMEGALKGLADGLDPDSAYLNAKQVADVQAGTALPEGSVGLELTRQYYLRVIATRDGSPAQKAGLQTGDYVRAVDGKSTRDMSVFEGTRLLAGQPGSKVTLTVIRGNAAEPHEVALVREKVSGSPVTGRLISVTKAEGAAPGGSDATAAYVRVSSFRTGVVEDLKKQIADLSKAGAKSLVIDLKGTAEGPIDNAVDAARLFVKSGVLAMKAGRNDEGKEVISAHDGDGAVVLPVQILMTAGTSGAAEVFAAALSANKRAELVGEHTLGRAAVQKLVRIPENRGLWLTYLRYYRPDGAAIQAKATGQSDPKALENAPAKAVEMSLKEFAIHGRGLQPDVAVEDVDVVEFGAPPPAGDPILDAAVDRLRKKSA